MSKSYRKPYAPDNYGSKYLKWAKRAANKFVRRFKKFAPNGGQYKRIGFNSWDIRDYNFWCGDSGDWGYKKWRYK